MKKGLKTILFLTILRLILPIPPYIECNHLSIVSKIKINCGDSYDITYYEILPKKDDNGILYHYKKYHVIDKSLLNGIYEIEKNHIFYKEKADIVIHCPHQQEVLSIIKETSW